MFSWLFKKPYQPWDALDDIAAVDVLITTSVPQYWAYMKGDKSVNLPRLHTQLKKASFRLNRILDNFPTKEEAPLEGIGAPPGSPWNDVKPWPGNKPK